MGFKRRMVTAVLAIVLVLSMAVQVFAAGSPTNPPEKKKNPGYVVNNNHDHNNQDHGGKNGTTVVSKVGKTKAIVHKVESNGPTYVNIAKARNVDNNVVWITHLGGIEDNGKPVQPFNNKTGKNITWVDITTQASQFRFSARAFSGSNVNKLRIAGKNIQFAKDMFTRTNVPNLQIQICGTGRKATQFTFEKGCFNKLGSGAELVVKSTAMTVPQYNLFVKRIRQAKFPGTWRRGRP